MRSKVLLAWATLLVACGSPNASGTVASSASPARTPGPAPVLLVVEQQPPGSNQPNGISLFSEGGKQVANMPLEFGANVLAVAGARIFVLAPDGTLRAIRRNGTVETLGTVGKFGSGFNGLVTSPDGTRWLWATQAPDAVASGARTATPAPGLASSQTIYLAGDGLATRAIATFAYPLVQIPIAWTPRGVLLDGEPLDYFGYRPFNTPLALDGLRLLDPSSGNVQVFTSPSQCLFSDEASDGTIGCFPILPHQSVPTLHMLRIITSGGNAADLSLAVPRFNYVGDAYFSPDGTMLTVAGATGAGFSKLGDTAIPPPEQYGTDLVRVADASIVRFGPDGVRPAMGRQSWLPDGRLVLWRPDTVGGSPGLYVLDPRGDGQGSEIPVTGWAVGYLTG